MKRARRTEIREHARIVAAAILETALGGMDERYEDEDEELEFQAEIQRCANRILSTR